MITLQKFAEDLEGDTQLHDIAVSVITSEESSSAPCCTQHNACTCRKQIFSTSHVILFSLFFSYISPSICKNNYRGWKGKPHWQQIPKKPTMVKSVPYNSYSSDKFTSFLVARDKMAVSWAYNSPSRILSTYCQFSLLMSPLSGL